MEDNLIDARDPVAPSQEPSFPFVEEAQTQDTDELRLQLSLLATDLAGPDPSAARRARSLAADIASGKLGELAGLDVHAVLDPDGIESRAAIYYRDKRLPRATAGFVSLLEWIRNITILVPITYTWFALSRAAANYQQVVAKDPKLVSQPFLLLWERGFVELGARHSPTFSELATTDFWILMVVVVLTVVVHFWREMLRDRHDAQTERKAASLRQRVEDVLSLLGHALAVERYKQTPGQAAVKVGEAIEHFEMQSEELLALLSAERERLEKLAERRERELGDLALFSDGLSTSTENLIRYTQDLRQVYERLQKSVVLLTTQNENAGQRQNRLAASIDGMANKAEALSETVSFVGHDLQTALGELKRSAAQITAGAQNMIVAVSDLREAAETVHQGETTLRQNLGQISEENRTISDDLRQAVSRIAGAGETIGSVLGGLQTVSDRMAEMSMAQDQLAATVSRVALRQVEVVESTQRALSANAEFAGSFRDTINSMTTELQHAHQDFAESEQRSMHYLARSEGQAAPYQAYPLSVIWRAIAVGLGVLTVIELGSILFLVLKVVIK